MSKKDMKMVVNDILVNYEIVGDLKDKKILLLHGWLDNLQTFTRLQDGLSTNFCFIALDLPGMGDSTLSKEIGALESYVNFVVSFLEKANLKVDYLLGHSFGGRVILKGVGEKKLKADKLILIGSAGIYEHTFKKKILGYLTKIAKFFSFLIPLKLYSKLSEFVYDFIGSDYHKNGNLDEVYRNIIKEDLQTQAKNIDIPTLLIYGENDLSTPVSYGRIFNSLIKNSEFKIIPGAAHFVHQEYPDEVVRHIKNFLQ